MTLDIIKPERLGSKFPILGFQTTAGSTSYETNKGLPAPFFLRPVQVPSLAVDEQKRRLVENEARKLWRRPATIDLRVRGNVGSHARRFQPAPGDLSR
jgi:hypothetical protein